MVLSNICVQKHSKRLFKLSENRTASEVIFENPSGFKIIEILVDGCVITDGIRCDYLVNVPSRNLSIFVELKGTDIIHALKQIIQSYLDLAPYRLNNVEWVVSMKRCPATSTQLQDEKLRCRSRYGIVPKISNTPHKYRI